MTDPIILTFLLFLLGFVAIGAYSATKKESTTEDYLLAGRKIGPWFLALSAVATNNSGFMFIGLIGATYTMGISGMWIIFGWLIGDYIMWFWVPRRLRRRSEEQGAETVPGFLGGRGANSSLPRGLAAIVTVLFLGTYSAAQLNAGSKALHVLFGWQYWSGAAVGAVILLVYCYAGGIRASIWTDVAQSCLMLGAIGMMVGLGVWDIGGFGALWTRLSEIDPSLISFTPRSARFGLAPYALGWFGAGFGVVGQPHIMVRAMAARDSRDIRLARHIYFGWYVLFAASCIGAALCCRVLLPADGSFDAELALPTLALHLLPPVLVGVVIAGLFSATMSTADSQVLVCAAALTQDLFPGWRRSYAAAKVGTVVVTAVALGIAVSGSESVFSLVTMAWSVLAASLGPLMIVRAMGWPAGPRLAAAMIVGGVAAAFVWRFTLGFGDDVFEALPGMIFGLAVYLAGSSVGRHRRKP